LNVEELRDYCLQKSGVTEGMPFGNDTLVFRVGNKIFLLMSLNTGNRFNVKCDPELAIELRDRHAEVIPGFHMNKTHWNSVYTDGNLTNKQLCEMIDHSYSLILKSLPKVLQAEITATK
jgi:predicted DNA-binding protein (MmcQ/YjbR family)